MTKKAEGFTNEMGTGDIQAPGGLYAWMGKCVAVGAATRPLGAVTVSKCRGVEGGFDPFNVFRAAPDDITFEIVAPKHKVAAIERRLESCPHNVRKRWSKCLKRDNLNSWQMIEDFLQVYVESVTDSGGTVGIDEAGANVLETFALKALCRDVLWRIVPARIGSAVTTLNINAVRWCSPSSCGECSEVSDGCQTFKAVTDAGINYLDTPKLIIATRASGSWTFAYVVRDITPFNAGAEHADDLDCLASGRVIAVSNAAGAVAHTDDDGLNWTAIALTVTGEPNAIHAADWTHIYVVGDLGYIYISRDGGVTFDVADAGVTLITNLYDVHSYGDTVAVVGDTNAFGLSRDGGDTWDAILGPNPAVNLTAVRCLSDSEILVGCADGKVYRTTDQAANWDLVVDFVAVLGAGAAVADWDFCGCNLDKGAILVNMGGHGYIFRTIDHAMTFEALEDDSGVVQQLPTNAGVNGIACCDPNVFVVVGEVQAPGGGYMALVK